MAERRKRNKIIYGEKAKLKTDDQIMKEILGEEQSRSERNKRHKKTHKKMKKRYIVGGIILALGITAGRELLDSPKEPKNPTEMTDNKKDKENYKESLQYKAVYPEKSDTEKAVNELKTQEDLESFLKNEYIEKYEEITGDTNLTTEDIEIEPPISENYVLINENNGQAITHGDFPDNTMQMLAQDGISYTTIDNINTYRVYDKNGNIIDCAARLPGQEELSKVIPGDRYQEMKEYTSILSEMGEVFQKGYKYYENIEKDSNDYGKIETKKDFIEAIENSEKEKSKTEEEQQR